eukprot:1161517-Pelagomonas_calceolata.AAC.2
MRKTGSLGILERKVQRKYALESWHPAGNKTMACTQVPHDLQCQGHHAFDKQVRACRHCQRVTRQAHMFLATVSPGGWSA